MRKITLNLLTLIFILITSFALYSCGDGKKNTTQRTDKDKFTDLAAIDTSGAVTGDWIIWREMADAEKLNPVVTNDASADQINSYMFEQLNSIDNITYELIPWIASLPEISEDHLQYIYKLRNDVKFQDGKPLTGEDVLFTIKCIKNPFADAAALRNYFGMVKNCEFVNGDKMVVKFTMRDPYWRAIYSLGAFYILPKHIVDPKGLTDKYTLEDCDAGTKSTNASMKEFADFLNSQEVSREAKFLVGSGPYKMTKWETGQAITLERDPNYWGMKMSPTYPQKIIFKVIQDNAASVVAAKNKEIDAMYVVSPADFYKTLENADQFDLTKSNPSEPVYSYIGWNSLNPLFADKKVRMALSHCVDRKSIIDKISYGQSTPIQSHIFFMDKKYCNKDLPEIPYDLEKAKQMLADAGWKDTDGDGILDKVINGKKMDFKFQFLNNNNPTRKQTVLVIIESLKKVGISADIQDLEWSVYLDKTKKHQFDATLAAWQLTVTPPDPFQIWHSTQSEGEGSNYVSFKNAESDKILEQYRNEFDEAKRIELMMRWQKLIYDEQPYTFLWSPKSRYIASKRFSNIRWYSRPNSPVLSEWWVPKAKQKYQSTPN